MTSAEENEIYLRGTISVLLCWDGLAWRVRRPATCLSSGQFVGVVRQKNFQIILWMDFWLHFRDTL